MLDVLDLHRLQFAFTVTYHYIFPQLTMGLALLIVIFKTKALRHSDEHAGRCAGFWARIFAISFVCGVVTGIPLSFQFGTNWAPFSLAAGGVVGQTLAMEGTFAFFLESAFLGLFLFGEKRLSPRAHWFSAFMVFVGTWLSAWFIIVTNAWMQRPVGVTIGADGEILLSGFWALFSNRWAVWQYLHTISGSLITASFAVAGVGAYYLLAGKHHDYGRSFVRMGVAVGSVAVLLQLAPTGHHRAMLVAEHQPATLAAMEGLFETRKGAPIAIMGRPDMEARRLANPVYVPKMLSLMTKGKLNAEVKGLDAFPEDEWPDNVPLVFYSYHLMVGLGMAFIAVMLGALWFWMKGRLTQSRAMLRVILIASPLPFIANTAGWTTTELGRQPWLIHGLMRTADGASTNVSFNDAMFSLIGFLCIYAVLSALYLFLIRREIQSGPGAAGGKP